MPNAPEALRPDPDSEVSKWKDDLSRWKTMALFFEYNSTDPVFTLKPHDHKGYPSLKQIYLELRDPTEYFIATEVLGGWEHWQKLSKSAWFREYLDQWRIELEIKLKAESLRKTKEIAEGNSGSSFNAAKYLAEKGWDTKRGRPSKEEIEREKKIQVGLEKELEDDLSRLNLN